MRIRSCSRPFPQGNPASGCDNACSVEDLDPHCDYFSTGNGRQTGGTAPEDLCPEKSSVAPACASCASTYFLVGMVALQG